MRVGVREMREQNRKVRDTRPKSIVSAAAVARLVCRASMAFTIKHFGVPRDNTSNTHTYHNNLETIIAAFFFVFYRFTQTDGFDLETRPRGHIW